MFLFCFCRGDKHLPARHCIHWNKSSIASYSLYDYSSFYTCILSHWCFKVLSFLRIFPVISIYLCLNYRMWILALYDNCYFSTCCLAEIWNYLQSMISLLPNITILVHVSQYLFLTIKIHGPTTFGFFPVQLKLSFAAEAVKSTFPAC